MSQERVSYNKEVQTTAIETDDRPDDYEENLRQRILRDHDIEKERLARDKELEEESVKLDLEIEQEIRGKVYSYLFHNVADFICTPELSEDERAGILTAPEFLDFVEQSSKIVQRALNDGYDYIRDYTIGAESGEYVSISFNSANGITR